MVFISKPQFIFYSDTVEEFMGFGKEPFQEMKLAMKFWPIQSCLTSQKLVHGLVLVMQYEADKIISK